MYNKQILHLLGLFVVFLFPMADNTLTNEEIDMILDGIDKLANWLLEDSLQIHYPEVETLE